MEPLVSVITPCYNGEGYLQRFLDSVLYQTYNNVEFIFINDGSKDKTEEIALEYKKRFEKRGFRFIYIYQENSGQAAAINKGLKIIKGKYLIWPDSDDILDKDNIKLKVEYLEKYPEKGVVAARCKVVPENDMDKIIDWQYNENEDNWVENLCFSNRYTTLPGVYMLRTDFLFQIYPNKQIYESREDQNFQLLLPMVQRFPYGNINNVLYTYVVREKSHSHKKRTVEEIIQRCNNFIILLDKIIKLFDNNYKKIFLTKMHNYECHEKYIFSIQYTDVEIVKKCYIDLKTRNICTVKDTLKYWRYRLKMFIKNVI